MPRIAAALLCSAALVSLSSAFVATQNVVRTADPAKRGLKTADFPRTIKVADNVYTYEDFHAGAREVHDHQHVRRHRRRRAWSPTARAARPRRKAWSTPSRRSRLSRSATSSSRRTTAITRPGTRVVPRRRDLHHPPDVESDLDRSAKPRARPDGRVPRRRGRAGERGAGLRASSRSSLGGEPIDILFLGRAHTGGDLSVSLPRQKILFLSEIVPEPRLPGDAFGATRASG
mgnify:CR=1 FL=1